MDRNVRINIVGAGIGGIVSALALRQFGFTPRLYEQAPALGDVGAGITLGPNAARVMIALGLEDALGEYNWMPRHAGILNGATGDALSVNERGPLYVEEFGAPFWHIHRADLLTVLTQALDAQPGVHFYLDHALDTITTASTSATAHFRNGESVEADVWIAADGLKSTVRDALFDGTEPEFTGYTAWRGLVERSLVTDIPLEPDFGLYVGPNKMVGRYGVRHRTLINFVAIARSENWTEEGWMVRATREEVLAEYEGWHSHVTRLFENVADDGCFKWALHIRKPIDTWVNQRVALLGDAAHPMTPFLGIGAGIAIEDAMILARAFAQEDDVDDALATYQRTRVTHANYAQAESSKQGMALLELKPGQPTSQRLTGEDPLGLYGYDAVNMELTAA